MLIYKEIHTTLNLVDPDDIYHPDSVEICIKKLTEKYVNKNYKSCHITGIEKIINVSARRVNHTLEGGVSIDVYFQVKAIQFSKNDVLHGCEVVNILSKNAVIAKTPFAGVNIKCINSGLYKIGDVIPAIVQIVSYHIGQNKISISASQFSPTFPDPVFYKITEPLNEKDMKKVEFLINKVDELESKKLSDEKKKIYKFFQSLVFPYKKETIFKKFKPCDHIKKLKAGDVVYIPNDMSKHRKGFVMDSKDKDCIDVSAGNFYSVWLIDYLKYIESLHGFVDMYTFSDIKSFKTIWQAYNMLKK